MDDIIVTRLHTVWFRACKVYPKLCEYPMPSIKFNGRIYRVAGRCFVEENFIEVSRKLFLAKEENATEILHTTIPHEVAHQIDFNFHGLPTRWHGPKWQKIMADLGQEPNKYHNMEL